MSKLMQSLSSIWWDLCIILYYKEICDHCLFVFSLDLGGVHIWANRVRVNIIMTESRTRSTYKLRSHLPLCILSRSCLSWPAQTGCWLHYRMLSKKHHFITSNPASNLLFKSVFLWMNWHIISHFFGFVLTWLHGSTTEWYGSINFYFVVQK